MFADHDSGVDALAETDRRVVEIVDREPSPSRREAMWKFLWRMGKVDPSFDERFLQIQEILDRSPETDAGDRKTGTVTTLTCGNTADVSAESEDGDPCPTCGRPRRPLTDAERQRRYRERKRNGVSEKEEG